MDKNVFCQFMYLLIDASSIDIGLELAGVVWPICQVGSIYNLHQKGGLAGGVPTASRMVKSVSFEEKKDISMLVVL